MLLGELVGQHHVRVGFEEFVGVVSPFFEETAGKECSLESSR